MRAKKAKLLRRMAREEMIEDPDREIVASPKSRTTAFNSPNSKRGFTIQLKKAYKAAAKQGHI